MIKYTYLLINALTIFFPLILSFDKRVRFVRSWPYLFPAMLITGLLFLIWDVLFTLHGVWSFNSKYLVGPALYGLPMEEVLFFLTVPFACLFIYACLNYYVRWQMPGALSNSISVLLMVLCVILLVVGKGRLYTTVTFGLLLISLIIIQLVLRSKWLPRFYLAYLVTLIPFAIVNGYLTSIPVVLYNDNQNLGIRLGTIPFEDLFYSMALLLINTALFEYFSARAAQRSMV